MARSNGLSSARVIIRPILIAQLSALIVGGLLFHHLGTARLSAQSPNPNPMAEAANPAPEAAPEPAGPEFGVSGDWGGLRSDLADQGITIQLTQIGEVLGVAKGGLRRHAIAEGRLQGDLDIDGSKAFGWPGLMVHAQTWILQGGQGPSRCCIGNIATVSNIEARPSARLFTLWAQQSFLDDKLSLQLGKLAADDEFAVSRTSALFMNSAFGWPAFMGANLPAGGPIFPLGAVGARIKAELSEDITVLGAVFSGDPVKPGPDDPLVRQPDGLFFDWIGGNFSIAEFQYHPKGADAAAGPANNYSFGVWYHDARFDDLRRDVSGRSLADPLSSGIARQHKGNWGVYVMTDIGLWQGLDDGTGDGSGFITLGVEPGDRNQVALMFSAGINIKGLIPARTDDVLGLAFSYLGMSRSLSDLDRDDCRLNNACITRRDHETVIELTYLAAITPWWSLQPNLQYVIHPGGHVPSPTGPGAIPDAMVGGLRTSFKL
jgi:porin